MYRRMKMEEITIRKIERMIYLIRGQKVMLDSELAELYGVTTKRLNEQVRRNPERFPEDFMIECNSHELEFLRSKFATEKSSSNSNYKKELHPRP
jgi:hypothetical protein